MLLLYAFMAALLSSAATAITCPTSFVEIDGACYSFRPEIQGTWSAARDFCTNLTTPSTLAMPKSPDTHRRFVEYIATYGLDGSFWLGGSDLEHEGDWHWVDKTRIDRGTPFWSITSELLGWSQEPGGGGEENCLALDETRRYYLNDVNCDLALHPVCQMK